MRRPTVPLTVVALVFLLAGGALLGGEVQQDLKILQEFQYDKIVLNSATIDSLLTQPLTLNDCVAIALKNNIQLQIDRLEYNRVYLAKKGTYQNYIPDFSLTGQRTKTSDLDSLGQIGKRSTADDINLVLAEKMPLGGSIQFSTRIARETDDVIRLSDSPSRLWSIEFTQPVLKGFGYSIAYSEVKLASLDYQIEQIRLRALILNTIFQVKEAYFNVLRQKKLIEATQKAIERDETLKEVSRAKVEAKLATRRDILSAEIILQKDHAELVRAQTEYQGALDYLKDVMGVPIEREIRLAVDKLPFQPVEIQEEAWIEEALANNLEIKLQEMVLKKGQFQTKLAANNLLPALDIELGYSRLDDNDVRRDSRNRDLYAGLRFSYPLYNVQASTEKQRAILAERQLQRVLEDSRRQIIRRVRNAARSMTRSITRIQILLKNIEAAKEKVQFATTMFNMGRASNLDITDAQEDLLKAEVDLVEEVADYYIQLAQLEELLGGKILVEL
jgi:outer membrane protein TolC